MVLLSFGIKMKTAIIIECYFVIAALFYKDSLTGKCNVLDLMPGTELQVSFTLSVTCRLYRYVKRLQLKRLSFVNKKTYFYISV